MNNYKVSLVLLVSAWNCGYSPTQDQWILKHYSITFCFPKFGFMILDDRFLKSLNYTALGLHIIEWEAKSCTDACLFDSTCTTTQVILRETEHASLYSYCTSPENEGLIAGRNRHFSVRHGVHTAPGVHPSSYVVCARRCPPGGKAVGAWSWNSPLSNA